VSSFFIWENIMDWNKFLQNGLSTAMDGYIQVETAKATEQVKPIVALPQDPKIAVDAVLKQNNVSFAGVQVNKNILGATAAVIGVILLIKVIK
jgi:hypothetical protein